jgi:hypothetical protein
LIGTGLGLEIKADTRRPKGLAIVERVVEVIAVLKEPRVQRDDVDEGAGLDVEFHAGLDAGRRGVLRIVIVDLAGVAAEQRTKRACSEMLAKGEECRVALGIRAYIRVRVVDRLPDGAKEGVGEILSDREAKAAETRVEVGVAKARSAERKLERVHRGA